MDQKVIKQSNILQKCEEKLCNFYKMVTKKKTFFFNCK